LSPPQNTRRVLIYFSHFSRVLSVCAVVSAWSCCWQLTHVQTVTPRDITAIMLGADKKAAEEDVIDLTEEDEVMDERTEEKDEEKDVSENLAPRYDIRRRIATIRRLIQDVDTTGIKLVPDGTRAPNVCVLARYSDETLHALWDEVKDNHTELETEQHRARGTSACWIWKVVSGAAGLENGYPVLTTTASLNNTVKVPYLKIHQLAAFIRTGHRTGLGKGAATIASPPGSRKSSWLLVASHLCHNKQCIRPDHIWPEANGWNADRGKCRGPGPCACKGYIIGGKPCMLTYTP